MSDYAIGDIQGCYDPLMRLLDVLGFDEHQDKLWFVGDLVNRGPQSLEVLRFIKSLPAAQISLGNHDLHLLASLFGNRPWRGHDDTFEELMAAPDAQELGHWLRKQPLICYSAPLNIVMCHAGIAPMWDLTQALGLAQELTEVLSGEHYREFLAQMYGNMPVLWSNQLQGIERLRCITNYFTRMRFCDEHGSLVLSAYKGPVSGAPKTYIPWYEVPQRKELDADIIFGHWAALEGVCPHPRIHAIDTGCLWGKPLTALRLQDKKRFSVPGHQSKTNTSVIFL